MRLIVCEDISYCGGVKRALELAKDALKKKDGPVYSLGPLIHNPEICELLEKRGMRVITSPQGHLPGLVVIRAHGVPFEERKAFEDAGFTICDATCPIVKRNLSEIKHNSAHRKIIIVGDKGHAEVCAMAGVEGVNAILISSTKDVDLLSPDVPYALFVQTTFHSQTYQDIVKRIEEKGLDVLLANKICHSSEKRRKMVLKLCKVCDGVVVVGGKNSANTRALADIVLSKGKKVWLIEDEREVVPEMRQVDCLGLASGASTSLATIERVKDCLTYDRTAIGTSGN